MINFTDHAYKMISSYNYYSGVEHNSIEMLKVCNISIRYNSPNQKAQYIMVLLLWRRNDSSLSNLVSSTSHF
jgi:hypothetical protein